MLFYECIIIKSKLDQYRHRESFNSMVEHQKKERGTMIGFWAGGSDDQILNLESIPFYQSFKRIKGSSTLNLETFKKYTVFDEETTVQ